jgi:HK97 family phage major capsid protein
MPTATLPTTSTELEELLNDNTRMGELAKEPDGLKNFIKAYAETFMRKDPTLSAQIREETQRVFAEMIKSNGLDGTGVRPPVPLHRESVQTNREARRNRLYNKKAPGAKLDAEFGEFSEYLQAVWHRADTLPDGAALAAKASKIRQIQNSFGSLIPADGGFLIPEEFRSDLLMWSLENSIVRPRATVIPMSTLRVILPMVDSTSNVSSVFGGIVGYWTEEGGALTESQAVFGQVVLDAKKLTAYAEVPNELFADAPAFTGFVDRAFPAAVAFYEDYGFIAGTGAGEPLGFVNCPASVAVAAEAGQATLTIVWENITKMYARMLPMSLGSAVWIASIDTFPQLATMALSVGTGGSAIWLNNGSEGPPMTILGRPVIFTEKTPALTTTGDINFVDLSYYLIGDRQIMQASSSPHFKFSTDKTAFKFIERVDGRPWLQSAITPKNNSSSTLSPFVQLATR